jgi:hypothetical protein
MNNLREIYSHKAMYIGHGNDRAEMFPILAALDI